MSDHEDQQKQDKPQNKRLFLNHVDSFQTSNLAKFLSQCVVGASLDEIEEEEEEETEEDDKKQLKLKEGTYQIYGTMKDETQKKPEFIKEIIKHSKKEELYEQVMECDIIVYDITEDPDQIEEAVWIVSQLHSDLEKIDREKPRMFVLLSSVLTWARSKPADPDDPEIPFTEDDYRRRKPHPNFKDHLSAEKTILKLGKTSKNRLITYVVASGLTYGAGENIFHYLFKAGWHNATELPCYGDGQNILPTIHIKDLAGVIQNIADSRPKVRYIIAVDDSKNTMEEIVKSVSRILTTGKMKTVAPEEVLLDKQVKQHHFDQLLVNMRMDGIFVKESMHIKWVAESGMVENIENIIKEYKETRNLLPIRVFITGPPASGKTNVVEQLCRHFKLHHIKIKDVLDETIDNMQKYITARETVAEDEAEEDEDEDPGKLEEYKELLEAINENKEQNNGRLDEQYVIRFFREKLLSKPCQNQGFILDGFPKTPEQAKDLFAGDDDADEEEGKPHYDKSIMPDLIVCLEANDSFLRDRIMNLPENVVAGTHNTEEGFTRRITEYRAINTDDETVLNYFDELEFHPEKIDITNDQSLKMRDTVEKIIKLIPGPRNYGPTPEEKEEMLRTETEMKMKKEAEEKEERERQEAEEAAERKKRLDDWAKHLDEVKREELELLETQSAPLRNYLMKHILPTVNRALIECLKVRPDDAVDYLAEYIFKHNPQVD